MLAEFSLKLVYSAMCGKNFQICGVHIPRKCIESRHFHSCYPPPYSKLGPKFFSHILGRGELLIPPGSIFQKTCFTQQQKGLEETTLRRETFAGKKFHDLKNFGDKLSRMTSNNTFHGNLNSASDYFNLIIFRHIQASLFPFSSSCPLKFISRVINFSEFLQRYFSQVKL